MNSSNLDIILMELDSELPVHWEQAFRSGSVSILTGDAFSLKADAIVSPANSFGFMDGGLDGKLRDFLGEQIELKVREKIKNEYHGELLVGQAFITETGNTRFPYLITAPTMRVPSDVSTSINAYLAMCAILRAVLSHDGINSLIVTGLCSLSGEMPSKLVARQMAAAYDKVMLGKYEYPHWRHERDFEAYLRGETDHAPISEKGGTRMTPEQDTSDHGDMHDLNRFITAQDKLYEDALTELKNGQKRRHWMWFIFPQIDGLGRSETAIHYSIKSQEEARQYLNHPVLGARLRECTEILLGIEGRSASNIFGFPDDLKLKSSMTLFATVAGPDSMFDRVLYKYFNWEHDTRTLEILKK